MYKTRSAKVHRWVTQKKAPAGISKLKRVKKHNTHQYSNSPYNVVGDVKDVAIGDELFLKVIKVVRFGVYLHHKDVDVFLPEDQMTDNPIVADSASPNLELNRSIRVKVISIVPRVDDRPIVTVTQV